MVETQKLDTAELMSVTKRLITLLHTEINMIKNMQLSEIHTLQDEKIKLTSVVEDYKDFILHNPDILAGIPPKVLADMKQVNAEFEQLIIEDGNQLLKARKIHSLVMEAIRNVLEEHRVKNATYDSKGSVSQSKNQIYATQLLSVSENV